MSSGGTDSGAERWVVTAQREASPHSLRELALADLRLQFFKVREEFVLSGPAREVEADHLVGAFRRFAAGVERNEKARDDRTVCLDLNADRIGAQKTATTENVLQESEEDFNRPAIPVDQGNHIGWHVEHVRCQP